MRATGAAFLVHLSRALRALDTLADGHVEHASMQSVSGGPEADLEISCVHCKATDAGSDRGGGVLAFPSREDPLWAADAFGLVLPEARNDLVR